MNTSTISTLTSIEADSEEKLPTRVHLLRVGKFKTTKYPTPIEITAEDMNQFVANFKAGHGRAGAEGSKIGLPINFSHKKGDNAAAWYNDMEFDGKDLWGTSLEWTGSGKRAILDKEFRCISSEFTPRCMGGTWSPAENSDIKVTNVFTGAALTNVPLFSGNHAISASTESNGSDVEQTIYINASEEEKESKMPTLDEVRVKDANSLSQEDKQVLANALVNKELSADELKKFAPSFGIEASAEKPATVEASTVTGSEGLVTVEASAIKELRDKVEASESAKSDLERRVEASEESLKAIKHKEIEASVKGFIAQGKIVASAFDDTVKRIEADATFSSFIEAMPANPALAAAQGEGDQGQGGADAAAILNKKAEEIMKANEGMVYADALTQARRENPELTERDNAAVTGE